MRKTIERVRGKMMGKKKEEEEEEKRLFQLTWFLGISTIGLVIY